MSRASILTLPCICACIAGSAAAAPPEWHRDRKPVSLTTAGGLSNQPTFDITFEKDSAGGVARAWIASGDGLRSYDGYRWKRYGVEDGLPSNFIRCVLVTRDGTLWVGTDKGAGVFRQNSFDRRGSEGGLAGPNVRRIIEDRNGVIWFTSDGWPRTDADGGIASLDNGRWRAWHKQDGLPSNYVVNQFTDSKGRHFAMTLGGPARQVGDRWVAEQVPTLRGVSHWGSSVMNESPLEGPVLSNGDDVLALRGDTWTPLGSPPRHQHGLAVTSAGRILIAGDTAYAQKAFFQWTGSRWQQISSDFPTPRSYGEELREAPDGSVWYLAFDSLHRWQPGGLEWSFLPRAPGVIFPDGGGGVWSRYREELYQLEGHKWILKARFRDSATDSQGAVWAAGDDGVTRFRRGLTERWTASQTGIPSAVALAVDGSGVAWLAGTDRGGLEAVARFDGGKWLPVRLPRQRKANKMVLRPAGRHGVWLLTEASDDHQWQALQPDHDGVYALPAAWGGPFGALMAGDDEGNLWLHGDHGLHRFGAERKWQEIPDLPARRVRSLGFQRETRWLVLDSLLGGRGGLMGILRGERQFFECAIHSDFARGPDGTLVVGGEGRVYVIEPGAITPGEILVPGGETVSSAFREAGGRYWIATSSAVALFLADRTPPETDLVLSSDAVLLGQPFAVSARALRRFQPPGSGDPASFSWRLDDGPWSPFLPSPDYRVEAARLALGAHRIAVRARDNGQDIDPTPAVQEFQVHPLALQERPWFVPGLLGVAILLLATTGAAAAGRRKLALQADELDKRVQERTAVLQEEVLLRRQAEDGLRESESSFREIVETAQEGIARFDSDGNCTLLNEEFARLIDRTSGELRGRHFREFLSPEVLPRIEREFERRKQGESGAYDLTWKHPDGSTRCFSISARPIFDSANAFRSNLVTVVDNTARKAADEAVRTSEAFYRLLFENSPIPKLLFDLETCRFLAANRMALVTYGYTRDEFLGLTLLDLQLEENLPAVRSLLATPMPSARNWNWRHRCKNGDLIDVDISAIDMEFSGKSARLIVAQNTTDRNRVITALKDSEANLAQAQRIAHIGSFQLRFGPDGFEKWSEEIYRIFGVQDNPARLTRDSVFEFVHPEDRVAARAARDRALASGQTVSYEFRITRPDGELRHVRVTAMQSAGSDKVHLVGTLQDITEYRVLEEQLRQAQKIESIGRLAGGVAHDFNNLLTVINGYSGRVLSRLDPAERSYGDLTQVLQAGRNAAALTRQLLAFSRKQMLQPRPLDLNAVVMESLEMLGRLIGDDIRLAAELHSEPVRVMADPVQLQQVLLNLCVNARDAMPNGGKLTIRTAVAANASRRCSILEVADTGIGMSKELQRQIFDPFFTTKERSGGTGLGLATVHGIVQQSGGEIEVESEPGSGTTFRIHLPCLDAPAAASDRPAATGARIAGPCHGIILVVEDRTEVRQFTAGVLRSSGYEVIEAAGGPQALALPESELDSIDLLLTDVVMPGVNGEDLASELRATRKPGRTLPVLFMSGYAEVGPRRGGGLLAAATLLGKPFTAEELLEKVAESMAASPVDS